MTAVWQINEARFKENVKRVKDNQSIMAVVKNNASLYCS